MELPESAALKPLVELYARLLVRLGGELGERPLVLPTADFFPDVFSGDEASAQALVLRMQEHAGMEDIPITTRVVGAEAEGDGCGSGGCGSGSQSGGGCCSSGGCGDEPSNTFERIVEEEDGWRLQLDPRELRHSETLVASLARALGHVMLVETAPRDGKIEAPAMVLGELLGVGLGFGPLLLQGAHIYSKGCGGPRVSRVTHLGVGDLAVATALFIARGRHAVRPALAHLAPTQQELLTQAMERLDDSPELVQALRSDPRRLVELPWEFGKPRSRLAKLLGFGRTKPDALGEEPPLEELRAMAKARTSSGTNKAKDELAALVDEALNETRASS